MAGRGLPWRQAIMSSSDLDETPPLTPWEPVPSIVSKVKWFWDITAPNRVRLSSSGRAVEWLDAYGASAGVIGTGTGPVYSSEGMILQEYNEGLALQLGSTQSMSEVELWVRCKPGDWTPPTEMSSNILSLAQTWAKTYIERASNSFAPIQRAMSRYGVLPSMSTYLAYNNMDWTDTSKWCTLRFRFASSRAMTEWFNGTVRSAKNTAPSDQNLNPTFDSVWIGVGGPYTSDVRSFLGTISHALVTLPLTDPEADDLWAYLTPGGTTVKTVFLTSGTTTWPVPAKYASLVSIEAVAPGGNGSAGAANTHGGAGGGGGEYRKITAAANILPGDNLTVAIGSGGSGSPTLLRDNTGTIVIQANAGGNAVAGAAGAGGTGGVGATGFNGGAGGAGGTNFSSTGVGGAGGGGAAGPVGVGKAGGTKSNGRAGAGGGGSNGGSSTVGGNAAGASSTGAAGGNGTSGAGAGAPGTASVAASAGTLGGGGGGAADHAASAGLGGAGGSDTTYDASHGAGGGGGGGGCNATSLVGVGGAGGGYGGGGGGGAASATTPSSSGGAGSAGLIKIVYNETTP